MKSLQRFPLSILIVLLFGVSSYAQQRLDKTDVKNYSFDMKQFSTLCVQDNVNVIYNCSTDSVAHIEYTSLPDFEDAFIFTNNNGTLKIQVTTEDVGKPDLPTLYISSNHLLKVENYSDFNIRVESLSPCDSFTASLVGNGSISVNDIKARYCKAVITTGMGTILLNGKSDEALLKLTGTGTIQADRLKCRDVTCKILGGGQITAFATGKLTTRGIGSTKIYYRGHPEINKKGGGKLFQID